MPSLSCGEPAVLCAWMTLTENVFRLAYLHDATQRFM